MEKLTCSVREALDATGIGLTKFYELINEGRVTTTKIGGRRLVHIASLRQLLAPTHKSTHNEIPELGEARRMRAAGPGRQTSRNIT